MDNKIHWSFWIIGGLALIWHLMGCANFLMQMNPQILENYPEPARELVAARPLWATIAFGVAVFGGALASLLLLLRKALALPVFVLALLGAIITNIHTLSVDASTGIWVGAGLTVLIGAFLVWYSRRTKKRYQFV